MSENCYSSDRIPREELHEQDDRLQTRHIQTLQFVQEIATENKELKKKVEEYEVVIWMNVLLFKLNFFCRSSIIELRLSTFLKLQIL